jgi:hypothetical protein
VYLPDLSENEILGPNKYPPFVSVGWLEPAHPMKAGQVSQEVFDALLQLAKNPVQDVFRYLMLGNHHCGFCTATNGSAPSRQVCGKITVGIGRKNIFVPGADGKVYVAPSTIVHYIAEHRYEPPKEFQKAVLECPAMWSYRYFKAMADRKSNIWSLQHFLRCF